MYIQTVPRKIDDLDHCSHGLKTELKNKSGLNRVGIHVSAITAVQCSALPIKEVRTNCLCVSLLFMQFTLPCHALSMCAEEEI